TAERSAIDKTKPELIKLAVRGRRGRLQGVGGDTDLGTESFGVILKRYRRRRGLTQEVLAERASLHAQEISKLERDVVRNPRSTTVGYLAEALKLDAQQKETFGAAARGESASSAPALVSVTDGETQLASMPTDLLPDRAPLPTGSRMPLAPNPLF